MNQTITMPDWDRIFENQGRVFTKPHPDMERIAHLFQDHGVQRILDLGCGTGRHLIFLSKMGFEIYGFDASPKALEIAEQWLAEEGLEAKLLCHSMEHRFPYDDEFFDAVISVQVIHHNRMKDIQYSVGEVGRVLRNRGLIFITIPILNYGPIEHEKDWDLEKIEEGTFIPRKGPETGIPHHYFTESEIKFVFSSFEIQNLYVDSVGHRCLLGVKK